MHRIFTSSLSLILIVGTASAQLQPKQDQVIQDVWNSAYLEGSQAGFVHTTVVRKLVDGKEVLRSTTDMNLTLKRNGQVIQLRMENGTDETASGKVVGVFMRQFHAKQQQLTLVGKLDGQEMHVKVDGGQRLERRIPWNDKVVGLYGQEQLLRKANPKQGDVIRFLSFEPTINSVLGTTIHVKGLEEISLPKGRVKLLRVEAVPDKIDTDGDNVQMPTMVAWLDDSFRSVKSEVELPPLGKLVLIRSTKPEAQRVDPRQQTDIGVSSLIQLGKRITRPYDTTSATYRITVRDEERPETTFARDSRQVVSNIRGASFDLTVSSRRVPAARGTEPQPGKEHLASSYFINCEDELVRKHARAAVGDENDEWEKALRIERYVHQKLERKNFSEAFATSNEVARTLEGDCTEHAVLAAAMLRVVGIPSRTAIGLVYVEQPNRGPEMGFHMWAEAYVRGTWMPIDATLGRGFVGATHLKIRDQTWHNTNSLTPLLPVMRVLGKLQIEPLSSQ